MIVNLKINRQIRALRVRVIDAEGVQLGVMGLKEALDLARESELDLVEVAPSADPPVCKIIDYGKHRYDFTKREKTTKKVQHHVKLKEIKVKLNIDDHDFNTKLKKARQFLEKGNKVKVTCVFRGRELAYPQFGYNVIAKIKEGLADVGQPEAESKFMGRSLICILCPGTSVKIKKNIE
ncbi:Translation initiation factor IF-3 [Candidatus Clavichlamydia salmonicola]|uniref:translation initiation factor IF-3 n=1 Tax=Candidatus Clavichlamydia salmonicola TaxID=469812 RepID=UPI0018915FA6|nr:translation initiation factor IF-3 [Candidatus Clavichlamydia salmonicola]MBF5050446.1 Translation initiation factor IF-3 [Candidatus Clavichlamydia salmonicola]